MKPRPPASIKRRLATLLLAGATLIWLALGAASFIAARHEIDELFDAQLAQSALVILAQAESGHAPVARETEMAGHKYVQKLAFQVLDAAGRVILRSPNAPTLPLTEHVSGFSDSLINGQTWRVFVRWDQEGRFQVQVAQSTEIRDELATDIALLLLNPLLFVFPALALLTWVAVGRGLAPLTRVTEEVGSRAADNLAPVPEAGAPPELQPLVGAVNRLLLRLDQAFENERRFTADAAHELRTPLAAIRTQAQVAELSSDRDAQLRALSQVQAGVERTTKLVEQLLTLARLDAGATLPRQRLDLADMAREAAQDAAPLAATRGALLRVDADGPAPVSGDPTMLAALLRNLVDNALRYGPGGGQVTLSLCRCGERVSLVVSDQGPGIPPDEREKVMERFYRVLGSGTSGSGLGLSIVKRVAEQHGARLQLGNGPGGRGLSVALDFPPAPPG